MRSKNETEIKNCLISELSNLISEHKLGTLDVEGILNYFRHFLLDSGVNSKIVVNVLESEEFGEFGKEEARNIKISEGW